MRSPHIIANVALKPFPDCAASSPLVNRLVIKEAVNSHSRMWDSLSQLCPGAQCLSQAEVQPGHLGVTQLCPSWANYVDPAAKIRLTQPELQTLKAV